MPRTAPQRSLISLGALLALPALATHAHAAATLVVNASASLAGGVGPIMEVRVNGVVIGKVEGRATTMTPYAFTAASLPGGAKVDLTFTNDAIINGQDRNLYVATLSDGTRTLLPSAAGAKYDLGTGAMAFDGLDVIAGQGNLYSNGALRLTWPSSAATTPPSAAQQAAARLLQQASFGPTQADISRVVSIGANAWVAEQLALPYSASYLPYVQAKYNLGDDYRPGGSKYLPYWVGQRFWASAATSPDQLRKRMAFALHQIFMVSQADSNIWGHARAYAQYQDQLNQHALGNYRNLMDEMALSPMMGLYLSHLRNRKESSTTGLLPDENFARELMQLFSIGLHELNPDGTVKPGPDGKPIETYGNADVMAMARVFTGWSWGFPDTQLTEQNFRWGGPGLMVATYQKIDLQRMKPYPGQYSPAEKRLFAGKPWASTIAANGTAPADLKQALDTLFNHPNVAPFIGRQLIQRLVTGHPSPAYVARVAAAFNNNGKGVRGDLAAVARAILLDTEARSTPAPDFGKVREPVLRVAHWMRAFGAKSVTGDYLMNWDLDSVLQPALRAPSVFGYFRPGYVPPNTRLADTGATAPEFQIVSEPTTASWVNTAEIMSGTGLGWTGSARDVDSTLAPQVALASAGDAEGLVQNLNLLLFAGRLSPALRLALLEAVAGVNGSDAASHLNRARVAVFIALSSPEYLVQR